MSTEYIYCLSAHQDQVMPVWRRIANRPLRVVADAKKIPADAILLCPQFAEFTPEIITRLDGSRVTVLWIESYE